MRCNFESKTMPIRPSRRLRWPASLWVSLLTWVVPCSAFAAPPKVEVQNIRMGFDASGSSMKASNTFKIGTWTPVWVQLRGGAERFSGFMDVMVADDDGTPTAYRMPVEVGANKSERFTAYVRPGSREPEISIRLVDQDGRRVGGVSQATAMPQSPEALMPN